MEETLRRPVVIYGNSFALESLDKQLTVLRSCVSRRHTPYFVFFVKNIDVAKEYTPLALKGSGGEAADFLNKAIVMEEIDSEEDASWLARFADKMKGVILVHPNGKRLDLDQHDRYNISVIKAGSSCCLPRNETDLECFISSVYETERCVLKINQMGEEGQRKILGMAELNRLETNQEALEKWQNLLNELREQISKEKDQRGPSSSSISASLNHKSTTVVLTTHVIYLFNTYSPHQYYFCHKELGVLKANCNALINVGYISSGSIFKVDILVDEQKYKSGALEPCSAEDQPFQVAAVWKHTPDKTTSWPSYTYKCQPSESGNVAQFRVSGFAVILRATSVRDRLAWNFSLGFVGIVNVCPKWRFLEGDVVHFEDAWINKKLIQQQPGEGETIPWLVEADMVVRLSDQAGREKLSLWDIWTVTGSILRDYIGENGENLLEVDISVGYRVQLPFRPGFVSRPSRGWPRDVDYTILTYNSPLWGRSVLLVTAKVAFITAMFLTSDNDDIGYFCHPEFGLVSVKSFSEHVNTGEWCNLVVQYTKKDRHKIDYNIKVCRVVGKKDTRAPSLSLFSRVPAVVYVFRADTAGVFGWNKDLGLVHVSDKPQHNASYWAKGFARLSRKFLSNPSQFVAESKVRLMAMWCFDDDFEKTDVPFPNEFFRNGIYIGDGVVKQLSNNIYYHVEADRLLYGEPQRHNIEVRNGYTDVPVSGLSDQLDCLVVAADLHTADGRSMFALRVLLKQPQQLFETKEETMGTSEEVLIIGGEYNDGGWKLSNSVLAFNPSIGNVVPWKLKLRVPRRYHMAGKYGGKIIVCGGKIGDSYRVTNSVEIIERISESAVQGPPMIFKREFAGSAVLGDHFYVFGGKDENDEELSSCECYSFETNQWELLGRQMPVVLAACSAVTHADNIYIMGGWSSRKESNCLYRYNTSSGQWTSMRSMHHRRGLPACCTLKQRANKILVSGGFFDGKLNKCEQYDVENDTWQEVAEMERERCSHALIDLNGAVYAIGGEGEDSIEKWYETTGHWHVIDTARLPHELANFSALLF